MASENEEPMKIKNQIRLKDIIIPIIGIQYNTVCTIHSSRLHVIDSVIAD